MRNPRQRLSHVRSCNMDTLVDSCSAASSIQATAESLLFAFMFPHGRGHNTVNMHMHDYCHMRMNAMFSVFTLCKPYLLVMYQIKHALILAAQCQTVVLEAALKRYREKKIIAVKKMHSGIYSRQRFLTQYVVHLRGSSANCKTYSQ
jgi:hypothetical protein